MNSVKSAFTGLNMVAKNWKVTGSKRSSRSPLVDIQGRPAGPIYYLLRMFMIESSCGLTIDSKNIIVEESNATGFTRTYVSIADVTSASYGFKKPWLAALIIAGIFFSIGSWIGLAWYYSGIIYVGGILIALAYYIFSQNMYVSFNESGEQEHTIVFQNSLVDRNTIDEKKLAQLEGVVQNLVEKK
ncbi:MAG: hypothetical protein RH862_00595 [Leptospiraceae bacterium]